MCPFYNAQLFEITGAAKGVFTHSQSSCHIAKVVLTLWHDSRQIPIACDAPSRPTSRGFLPWRFSDAGPGVRGAVIMGRHPKTFTISDSCDLARASPQQGLIGAAPAIRAGRLGARAVVR